MPLMFKLLRFILKLCGAVVAFVVLYFFSAQTLSALRVNIEKPVAGKTIDIFVKSNGVHTDIIVPTKNTIASWRDTFDVSSFEHVDSTFEYVSFGWGDKGFYLDTPTWDDLKASTAFKAAFFMSSTAMHVTYKRKEPKENRDCVRLKINEGTYKKLCAEISTSFKRSVNNLQLIKHPGYGDTDNFYEAEGTYSFLKTCNVWTGSCLANSDICVGFWTPFDWNVMSSIEN